VPGCAGWPGEGTSMSGAGVGASLGTPGWEGWVSGGTCGGTLGSLGVGCSGGVPGLCGLSGMTFLLATTNASLGSRLHEALGFERAC
jgi:hypothetical protein